MCLLNFHEALRRRREKRRWSRREDFSQFKCIDETVQSDINQKKLCILNSGWMTLLAIKDLICFGHIFHMCLALISRTAIVRLQSGEPTIHCQIILILAVSF